MWTLLQTCAQTKDEGKTNFLSVEATMSSRAREHEAGAQRGTKERPLGRA